MSNDMKNVLKLYGTPEAKEKVFKLLRSKNSLLDFNNIVKMPESIKETIEGNISDDSYALYMYEVKKDVSEIGRLKYLYGYSQLSTRDFATILKNRGASLEIGEKIFSNEKIYGCHTWYDWCKKYWGVKGNAYDISKKDDSIIFYTANKGVPNLIYLLSLMFPYVKFEYSYAGDCYGYNCSYFLLKNGDLEKTYIPNEGTKEAENLSHKIYML